MNVKNPKLKTIVNSSFSLQFQFSNVFRLTKAIPNKNEKTKEKSSQQLSFPKQLQLQLLQEDNSKLSTRKQRTCVPKKDPLATQETKTKNIGHENAKRGTLLGTRDICWIRSSRFLI